MNESAAALKAELESIIMKHPTLIAKIQAGAELLANGWPLPENCPPILAERARERAENGACRQVEDLAAGRPLAKAAPCVLG